MKQQQQKKNKLKNQSRDFLHSYAKYSGIAIQMMVVITAGIWGGVELDKLTGMDFPLLTVILSIVSVSLAIYISIKDLLNNNKK
ncbi:MAG: AtpZ/AtpI family protein [Bacteroidales bacterium]